MFELLGFLHFVLIELPLPLLSAFFVLLVVEYAWLRDLPKEGDQQGKPKRYFKRAAIKIKLK